MALVTVDGGQSSSAVAGRTLQYMGAIAAQQLSGAPDTLIQSQLVLTLRHFYTQSTAYRGIAGPYPVTIGKQNVYLNPVDQDTEVQFVLEAYIYPTPLGGASKQSLPPSTRLILTNVPGPPNTHFMVTPDTLVIQPVPDATYGSVLYVYGALRPSMAATTLPDISFTHHLDGILAGLFERMYRMPNKPWTDPELSVSYGRMYKTEIAMWRDFAVRGQSAADVPFIFPSFADSRFTRARIGFGSSA